MNRNEVRSVVISVREVALVTVTGEIKAEFDKDLWVWGSGFKFGS